MSANLRLLTEEESAHVAEVSIDTIRKYKDCGLLDPIVKDNTTFFQELDIRTLFYTKFKDHNPAFALRSKPEPSEKVDTAESAALNASELVGSPSLETAKPATESKVITPEFVQAKSSETQTAEPDVQQTAPGLQSSEMLELNKSLRLQIQILREERDWLRDRIERLETRSEREQMLLLSQNENVRNLIKTTSQKSFWSKALPWLK